MHHDLEMPGAVQIVGGYVAAVGVAAFTAAVAMSLASSGAPFFGVLVIGAAYIALTGLPGFAVTVFLARRHGWNDWLPFAICGGFNAALAWYLVHGQLGLSWTNDANDILLASLRGGVAGGVAYWWTAYYGMRKRAVGAVAKTG